MTDNNHNRPTGKHTLVEEGTEFTGTLSSKCPIVVMGKVEGEVSGPVIHVTPTGVVAGNVKVKDLRSEGELAGEVQAETVRIAGKVRDHTVIKAKSLEVSLSVSKGGMEVVFGECELAIGDEPNKEAAIAAATSSPTTPQPPKVADTSADKASASAKRRGAPETWSDTPATATATTTTAADDTDGTAKPRRGGGTQPPPLQ
jgi:cytoskeletal protein CcmA (bactofilin family)